MLKSISFFTLLFIRFAYAGNHEKGISTTGTAKKLLSDEKTVSALRLFTQELTSASKNKQTAQAAEDIYWIAECLLQLKQYKTLGVVLNSGKPYIQKYDPASLMNILLVEAKYIVEQGKYKEAIGQLQKLAGRTNNKADLCKIQLISGDACFRNGNLEKSNQSYTFVLNNTTDPLQKAEAYNGIGSYYFLQTQLDSAALFYYKALELYRNNLGDKHTKTALIIYNLGLIAEDNADYYTAETYLQSALSIYREKLPAIHLRIAEAYGALGSLYMVEDDPERALLYFAKEKNILERLHGAEHPDNIFNYLNSGTTYYYMHDLYSAEQQLRHALKLTEQSYNKNHHLYSTCAIELSKVLIAKKQFADAEELLLHTIAVEKNDQSERLADAYYQMGENYLQQRDSRQAMLYFSSADKLYSTLFGKNNIYSADVLCAISDVYLLKEDPVKANDYAILATRETIIENHIVHPYDHWICRLQSIKCRKELYKRGQLSDPDIKADIELIRNTIREANKIKQTYYSQESRMYYAEKMAVLNELGIYFITHFYKARDEYFANNLLFFAENNKANLLRNKITKNTNDEILPKQEQGKSAAIIGRLNYFISLNENQEKEPFNINDSILFYQNAYEKFSKSIEHNYPKIYALKYGEQPLTLKEIRDRLKENYTLLEYCNDGEYYYCLAVSKNRVIYKYCGNKQTTDSLIGLNQSSVIHKHYNADESRKIFRQIIPTSLEKNLVISPDADIHALAFDALADDSQQGSYLIYHHTIQYTFSASTYFRHQQLADSKSVLAFCPSFQHSGYAVLNSKKETDVLRTFFDFEGISPIAAKKKLFIQKCNNSGIIHIASHLLIDTLSPLRSSLVFQPDNENYLLSINEIWKLSVNSQLITLAACRSNFGLGHNGEGIQNFAWAFHYAGAHNILSTQWDASDKSTSGIMSEFYKNLKNGKSKQESLQSAKINYLRNTDAIGAQPFFWANYSLYGDESGIDIATGFLALYWWTPVLVLTLCYLALITYKKILRKGVYETV